MQAPSFKNKINPKGFVCLKKICSFLEIDSLLIEQIIPSGIVIMCP